MSDIRRRGLAEDLIKARTTTNILRDSHKHNTHNTLQMPKATSSRTSARTLPYEGSSLSSRVALNVELEPNDSEEGLIKVENYKTLSASERLQWAYKTCKVKSSNFMYPHGPIVSSSARVACSMILTANDR